MTDAALFPAPPEAFWRAPFPPRERSPRLAAAGSIALHAAIFAAAILLIHVPASEEPPERRVNVEIIDAGRFDEAFAPEAPEAPAEPDEARFAPQQDLPEVRPDGLIVARTLRSDSVLDDPRSADARAALPMMQSDERLLQLCGIEAMAQVADLGDVYAPDMIVTYAMDDVRIKGSTARAPGAAVRSKGHWFNLRFECSVTPDLEHVVAFAFKLGEAIPEAEWEGHNLVAGEDLDHH
ncbi:DUF930 domain-containing protein [Oricola sp.]|uniref:DUF930 domain-containing protein n=1 Tax=Oricola sp. TaxID=1979950 RepID=UPI003517388F